MKYVKEVEYFCFHLYTVEISFGHYITVGTTQHTFTFTASGSGGDSFSVQGVYCIKGKILCTLFLH